MKRFKGLFLLFTLTAVSVMAQNPDPLKTKAFSFGFNGLSLSGPYGGNVGGKMWLSGNRAVVMGVYGNANGSSSKTPDTLEVDRTSSDFQVGLNAALQQHFEWSPGLSPYLTLGAVTGLTRYKIRSENAYDTSSAWQRDFNVGLNAGFGLEYWFARRLSLSGQQTFSAILTFGESQEDGEERSTNRGFSVGLGTSALTLNVYL